MKDPSFHIDDFTRRYTRRSDKHRYDWPARYMFTLTQHPGLPPFCTLSGSSLAPVRTLTPFGQLIDRKIRQIPEYTPAIQILGYVIMPDHIHLVIHVTDFLDRKVGYKIGGFMGGCTSEWRRITGKPEVSVFKPYHDRIIHDGDHLQTVLKYVADNPRRLLIKREYPDLFRVYNHLQIHITNGLLEFAAYGNLFLLRDFQKEPVRIHRRWSPEELEEYREKRLACTANGGVLVSPFIHPWERQIRDEALALGGRIIALRADGFPERFKPSGEEFRLCSEGRLLLLAPWPKLHNVTLTRAMALDLNDLATRVAALTTEYMTLVGG